MGRLRGPPVTLKPASSILLFSLAAHALAHRHPLGVQLRAFRSKNKDALQRPDALLDKMEQSFNAFFAKRQHHVIDTIAGGMLLFCSKELPFTLLFAQSFHAIGGPLIKDGWSQLCQSYSDARESFKAELPSLMRARSLFPRLVERRRAAEELLSEAVIFVNHMRKDVKQANHDVASATKSIQQALPSRSEMEKMAATLKPDLPSYAEVRKPLLTAKRVDNQLERKLDLAEEVRERSSEHKAYIKVLKREKRRTEAALSKAQARWDYYDTAMQKVADRAMKALPNAKELQKAKRSAERTKVKLEKRLEQGLSVQQNALQEYSKSMVMFNDVRKVSNSVQAIAAAIDTRKVRLVAEGIGAGVTGCLASVAFPAAGTTLVGVDVGSLIAEKALPVSEAMRDFLVAGLSTHAAAALVWKEHITHSSTYFQEGVKMVSAAAGIMIVHRARSLALLCSGALIGSKLVVSAITGHVEAALKKTTIDEEIGTEIGRLMLAIDRFDKKEDGALMGIQLPVSPRQTCEVLLAMAGILLQLRMADTDLPILGILKSSEAYLKGVATSPTWGQAKAVR